MRERDFEALYWVVVMTIGNLLTLSINGHPEGMAVVAAFGASTLIVRLLIVLVRRG